MARGQYTDKEVPDVGLYDAGTYDFKVTGGTRAKETDPMSYSIKFTITAPESHKGRAYTERFGLATEDDPDAEQPETKRGGFTGINWGRWKSLTKAAGVFSGNAEEEFDALLATKPDVTGDMTKRSYEDKTTHEMKGPFNNIARFYAPGKKEAKVNEDPSQGSPSNSGSGKPSGNTSNESGKAGQPASSAKVHCDECDRDVPKRLYDNHMKRHEVEAASGEEEE